MRKPFGGNPPKIPCKSSKNNEWRRGLAAAWIPGGDVLQLHWNNDLGVSYAPPGGGGCDGLSIIFSDTYQRLARELSSALTQSGFDQVPLV